jgi:hypothetical protein
MTQVLGLQRTSALVKCDPKVRLHQRRTFERETAEAGGREKQ